MKEGRIIDNNNNNKEATDTQGSTSNTYITTGAVGVILSGEGSQIGAKLSIEEAWAELLTFWCLLVKVSLRQSLAYIISHLKYKCWILIGGQPVYCQSIFDHNVALQTRGPV